MRGADVDVRQGAGVVAVGEVLERRLDERAVLAVEAAFAWVGVSSRARLVILRALRLTVAYRSANNCQGCQLSKREREGGRMKEDMPYAMAEMRGPRTVYSSPFERTLSP